MTWADLRMPTGRRIAFSAEAICAIFYAPARAPHGAYGRLTAVARPIMLALPSRVDVSATWLGDSA